MGVKTNMYFWDKEASETEKKMSYYEGKEKEFIIEQLRKNGLNLQYIPINMKSDRDVVLAAVRNDGTALEFASTNLQNNCEIVKAAVLQSPIAINFSEQLKGDKGFITSEMSKYIIGIGFEYLSENLRNDVDIANIAIRFNSCNLQYAGAGIRYWCKELVLSAVSRYDLAFKHVHRWSHLLHDTEILVAAVSLNWRNVQYLSRYTSAHVKEWLSKIAKEQLNESDHTYGDNLRFIDAFTTQKLEGHEKVAEKSWVNVLTGLHTLSRSENEEMPSYPEGFKQHQISYNGIFYNGNVDDIDQANQLPFTSADAVIF